jgi:hypothetical protein
MLRRGKTAPTLARQSEPMRWKLLARRLTISAPRMTVRSHIPWPLRWAVMALVLGLSGAIALWAFEFGKSITGLDSHGREEFARLQGENRLLKDERDKLLSTVNTAESLLKTEKAAQTSLAAQVKALEAENGALKEDLRFFERLIPSNGPAQDLAVRALQTEANDGLLRYRMLVMQSGKNPPEFSGRFELVLSGVQAGRPWSATFPAAAQQQAAAYRLVFKGYQRVEGEIALPPNTVLKSVQARVLDASGLRSSQTARL